MYVHLAAATAIIALGVLLPPAALGQEATGTAPAATDQAQQADMQFAKDAAAANKAEVELGQHAVDKASAQDVKQFGQRMVDDHSKAKDQLMQIAQNKNIEIPADLPAEMKNTKDRLSGLSGNEFDREFITVMVTDHEKAVDLFTNYTQNGQDAELKQYAEQTLPALREHLEEAQRIESGLQEVAATDAQQPMEEQTQPAAGAGTTSDAGTAAEGTAADQPATRTEQTTGEAGTTAEQPAAPETQQGTMDQPTTTQEAARPAYPLGDKMADDLIGQTVVNQNGEDVGTIEDIVLNANDKAVYAIVSVGGFLGIGDKNVIVAFDQLQPGENETILMSSATEEDLKARPAFEEGAADYTEVPRDRPIGEGSGS